MKRITILWSIIILLLFIFIYSIGLSYSKTYKPYQILESDYVESAQIYLSLNDIKLNTYQTKKITSDELVKSNCLSESKVDDDECTGYVIVKKNLTDYEYKAYIKCKNYTTIDYES